VHMNVGGAAAPAEVAAGSSTTAMSALPITGYAFPDTNASSRSG
jgi:hypothetical protein